MNNDLISIIMPCYNVEKFIGESIESVINQTYKNVELIVVNDFTPDESANIAKKYAENDSRIIVVDNEFTPHNVSGVMNTGLKYAKGKYVTRLDSDDYLEPTKIEEQYNYLEKNANKNIVMCSTNILIVDSKGIVNKYHSTLKLRHGFNYKFLYMFENPLPAAPCMFIKKIIDDNNLMFDEKYKTAEDFDFISKYLQFGDYSVVDKPLYCYRILSTGITGTSGVQTSINSLEICDRNVQLFLDKKAPYYHKYLTRYYDRNVYGTREKRKTPYLNLMELSNWSIEFLDSFFNKYNIPKKEQNKYIKYMNAVMIEYWGIFNPQTVYCYVSLYQKVKYYYITYGLWATIKKIIKKITLIDYVERKMKNDNISD